MIGTEEHELLLRCQCGMLGHMAMLTHSPNEMRGNNLKGEGDDWYLSVSLGDFSFWLRAKKAMQYLFRPSSLKYGMWSEIVLKDQDARDIVDFIVRRQNL